MVYKNILVFLNQTNTIMETNYLLLAMATATFGFIIWYALSASIKLPKYFQIHYDINGPYINRIFRRRLLLFLIYVFIPYLLISEFGILGHVTFADLEIHFVWKSKVMIWLVILVPIALVYNLIICKKDFNLNEYPEIRVTIWTPKIFALSAITWIMQAFAIEFLFRGLLLQSLMKYGFSAIYGVFISAAIYAMTNYFRQGRASWFSILFGLLAAYIVVDTQSIWPVIIIHICYALFNEWLSVRSHPEIRIS